MRLRNKKQPSDYLKNQILVDTISIRSDEGFAYLVSGSGVGQVRLRARYAFNWHSNVDLVLTQNS